MSYQQQLSAIVHQIVNSHSYKHVFAIPCEKNAIYATPCDHAATEGNNVEAHQAGSKRPSTLIEERRDEVYQVWQTTPNTPSPPPSLHPTQNAPEVYQAKLSPNHWLTPELPSLLQGQGTEAHQADADGLDGIAREIDMLREGAYAEGYPAPLYLRPDSWQYGSVPGYGGGYEEPTRAQYPIGWEVSFGRGMKCRSGKYVPGIPGPVPTAPRGEKSKKRLLGKQAPAPHSERAARGGKKASEFAHAAHDAPTQSQK
jgi:hypothetical protein